MTVTSPAASSKVLLIAHVPIELESGASVDAAGSIQFHNGTSAIGPLVRVAFQDATNLEAHGYIAWIDTPSGTTTYTVQGVETQDGVQTHSSNNGHFSAIEIPTAEFGQFVSAIDNTSDIHVQNTFTNMTGQTTGSITPASGSTLLVIANGAAEGVETVDEVTYWRFAQDGTAEGPTMVMGSDAINDVIASSMMYAFDCDGSAHTWTMQSMFIKTAAGAPPPPDTPETGTDDRSFQAIELTKSGVLIETDSDTTGPTMANAAAWQSIAGLSITHTPTNANAPLIFIGQNHLSISAPDGTARTRFWDGSATIGAPQHYTTWADATNEFCNLPIAAGVEDAASATTYVLQDAMLVDVGAEMSGDTTYGNWLQLLDLGIDAVGGANPKGPFGLPLHGPFGGPI